MLKEQASALSDLKILDISTMLAAPWSSTFLADFGAQVVKVEHPIKGDHARQYGQQKDGVSVLWKTLNRNKKSITLDLSSIEGQDILKEIIPQFDVIVENFRPGTLEKWNIGWDVLSAINPSLVMLRTTGYGQSGPYSSRAGFGTVAEAISGFTSVNGNPDGPPTLPGLSLADGVNSAFGALSIMIALHERAANGKKEGQCIDISLYEPLMRLLEPHISAYDQLGYIAPRVGNGSVSVAPRNAYETKEGRWVALSGATQSIATNIFTAIGQRDLINDPRFTTNEQRVKNSKELDIIIGSWIKERPLEVVFETFNECGAVIGAMNDMGDLFEDPHFKARESFIKMQDKEMGEVTIPNVVAKFSRTPGKVESLGADKGQHTNEFYKEILGLSEEAMKELKEKNII